MLLILLSFFLPKLKKWTVRIKMMALHMWYWKSGAQYTKKENVLQWYQKKMWSELYLSQWNHKRKWVENAQIPHKMCPTSVVKVNFWLVQRNYKFCWFLWNSNFRFLKRGESGHAYKSSSRYWRTTKFCTRTDKVCPISMVKWKFG